MLKNKIFLYTVLLVAIFFSLFFVLIQNQEYQEAEKLENSLYQKIRSELTSYHEGLYQIEQSKKSSLDSSKDSQKLGIGTTVVTAPPSKKTLPHQEGRLEP